MLVVGGSRTTPGAVLLAGTAALRAGAGRLQLATTDDNAQALSIAVPEAKVVGLPSTADGAVDGDVPDHLLELAGDADVVAIGPGLDDEEQTATLLHRVIGAMAGDARLVIDAYALGALGEHPDLLGEHASRTVLTPNVGEAGRLLGREPGDDLDAEAAAVAERFGAVVSLYGHVGRARRGSVARRERRRGTRHVRQRRRAGRHHGRPAGPRRRARPGGVLGNVRPRDGRPAARPAMGRTGYLARELVDEVAATIAMVD